MAKKSFEQALQLLEKIVQELETGDLPLEKAMSKFEEGIQLTRYCSQKLDESEKKINLLLQDQQGNVSSKPFEADDGEENRNLKIGTRNSETGSSDGR
ncbi:MAG: exodeoxyribonuclease VII small subunit [Desulfobacterales bacterium]|jgi:exodeoxyribonuclease VII small subunit